MLSMRVNAMHCHVYNLLDEGVEKIFDHICHVEEESAMLRRV
jgi:hypothetical protein